MSTIDTNADSAATTTAVCGAAGAGLRFPASAPGASTPAKTRTSSDPGYTT